MMLLIKTKKELNDNALSRLTQYTDITNVSPGSRARALVEIFNEQLGTFYTDLEFNVYMTFLSKAQGMYLDWAGETVSCSRLPGEDDDTYRYRISQQIYVAKGANETALRLKILSLPEVYDVVMKPFTLGTGSFHVYVIPMDPLMGSSVISSVQAILDSNQAYGINGKASLPKEVKFGIDITLIIKSDTNGPAQIRRTVQRTIRDYINAIGVGQPLLMTDLISTIKLVDKDIVDFKMNTMHIRNRPVLFTNYELYWDEKFVADMADIVVG